LREARITRMLDDSELYLSLNESPSKLWGMPFIGKLDNGMEADIVVARKNSSGLFLDSFFLLNPEDILMVMSKGRIRLIDEDIINENKQFKFERRNFSTIRMKDRNKYIFGDLPGLMIEIKKYYNGAEFPVEIIND